MKENKFNLITVVGVFIIALSSFALSFDALTVLAKAHGLNPSLAWLFPVSLDLSILVYSLASLKRRNAKLEAKMETGFVVFFTLVSVILNTCSGSVSEGVMHSILHFAVHALPPLFIAASVEAYIRMISSGAEVKAIRSSKARETRITNKTKGRSPAKVAGQKVKVEA